MATGYIGKLISLTSHSDIRYVGTLAGIDPQQSTIQLSNVVSKGTEHRRPAAAFIPPNPQPYEYIVFRAKEVKELNLEHEPVLETQNVLHADPAIASAQASHLAAQASHLTAQAPVHPGTSPSVPPPYEQTGHHRQATINSARRGMESVERAMNDLQRPSHHSSRNNNHGAGGSSNNRAIIVPTEDFDFQTSNARFDKTQMSPAPAFSEDDAGDASESSGQPKAYDRTKSFFDTFDSAGAPGTSLPSLTPQARNERRVRREEERARNVSTFGSALPDRNADAIGGGGGRGWGYRGGPRGGGYGGPRGGGRGRGPPRGGPREVRA